MALHLTGFSVDPIGILMSMRPLVFSAMFALASYACLHAESTASPKGSVPDLSLPVDVVEKMRRLQALRTCATAERRYALSQEGCDALHHFEPLFERMLAVAGFSRGPKPGQIQLLVDEISAPDKAAYHGWGDRDDPPGVYRGIIQMSVDWLFRPEGEAVEMLGHELGHAAQYRDIPDAEITSYSEKQLESHADFLGLQIDAQAGFAPARILVVRGARSACWGHSDGQHADHQDYWVNSLIAAQIISRDRVDASDPFHATITPAVFDEAGRFRTRPKTGGSYRLDDLKVIEQAGEIWSQAAALAKDLGFDESQLPMIVATACADASAVDLASAVRTAAVHIHSEPGLRTYFIIKPARRN